MDNNWKTNCAKTVGRQHLRNDPPIPCQDSVLALSKNDVNVIALSDGCGSSMISEIGSDITTKTICSLLTSDFDKLFDLPETELKKRIILSVVEAIKSYIATHRNVLNDFKNKQPQHHDKIISLWPGFKNAEKFYQITIFDATIQFVAIKNDKMIVGRLGDGVIGAVRNNNLYIASMEDKIGVSDNATWYPSTILIAGENPGYDVWRHFEIIKSDNCDDCSAFFICSDGLADVLIGEDGNFKFADLDETELLFTSKNLFEVLEEQYKPLSGIYDDLSVATLRRSKVQITGVVFREYDENGLTVSNTNIKKVSDVHTISDPIETVISREEPTIEEKIIITNKEDNKNKIDDSIGKIELPKDIIEKINDLIKRESNVKEMLIIQTKKARLLLKDRRKMTFDELFECLKPDIDEQDFRQIKLYWEKIKPFEIDGTNGTIEMR